MKEIDPNFFININVGITNSDVSQTHVTALGSKKSNGKVIFAKDGDKNRSAAIEIEDLNRSIKSRRNHLEYLRNRTRDQLRSAPKRKSDIKLSDYDVSFARQKKEFEKVLDNGYRPHFGCAQI